MSKERLAVSRLAAKKRDASRIASKLKRFGAVDIKIHGKRGLYRVRARIELSPFAKFCADEAREQSKN